MSGRIYTLKSNWMLEVWSVEQTHSSPLVTISVCSGDDKTFSDEGIDYIDHYYKDTFNGAKPKFLSLVDSN
jgi:hypothetical protein